MPKTTAKKSPDSQSRHPLNVGDKVRFQFGVRRITGEVIEDRGNLGVGGRRLLRIRFPITRSEDHEIELPEADVELVPLRKKATKKASRKKATKQSSRKAATKSAPKKATSIRTKS